MSNRWIKVQLPNQPEEQRVARREGITTNSVELEAGAAGSCKVGVNGYTYNFLI
jgi:hypothetical protein